MSKQYVLVSQGIEIFRTDCKEEAESIMNAENEEWYEYVQSCLDEYEPYSDNEIFMCEEYVEE